ncbi:MAG: four helix bundle protein [Candidatus Saccharibacteria bacterium]
MARYNHLSVYQNTYELNLYFFKLARGFPKDFRYGLASEIKSLLSDMLDQIVIANSSADKGAALQKATLDIERIKFKSRMLNDLKVMSLKSYEYFFKQLVEISKQFGKWYIWAKNNSGA